MENNEHTFNDALGAVLQQQRRGWKNCVKTEQNGSIISDGARPGRADNLIYADEMQPVVVEAAFVKTANIDGDAISRLGRKDGENKREIMTAVALAIPVSVKKIKGGVDGIKKWLEKGGKLEYAVYSLVKGESGEFPECGYDVRYPDGEKNKGYISGTAADLADLIELAATPDKRIKQVAEQVGGMVRGVANLMNNMIHPVIREQIADKVGQPADIHAMRVAACIWLNALILQGKLAKVRPGKITPPHECKTWDETMDAWKEILEIDYKSVFRPAMESLNLLSVYGYLVVGVLESLHEQLALINNLHLGSVADVSSDMFPELATDRAETAAFYTRPEVAELLAGVAFNLIPKTKDDLKIADFACGTGTLLKAAYRHVRRRAKPADNLDSLHKRYMENCLHGADIQPIAAHLTAAGLAGMNPGAVYRHSNIICASVKNGKTGALDLLKSQSLDDLFGGGSAKGADNSGVEKFRSADNSFDLCIMNPPYTRNRGGRKSFDVRGVRESHRRKSIANLQCMLKNSFADMTAGMASAFCALSDQKLKEGGILATVLPLTAAGQGSWRQFRAHILMRYSEVMVIGLVPGSPKSFSADTNMEEMLVCGRKNGNGNSRSLTIINLHQLPRDFIEAHEITRAVRRVKCSGELKIGDYIFGNCIKLHPINGETWGAVGVKSYEIGVIAENLVHGKLIKLGLVNEINLNIPIKNLSTHLSIGPSHDHIGYPPGGDGRGAFSFDEIKRTDKTNLSLWRANYQTQIRLVWRAYAPGQNGKRKREYGRANERTKFNAFYFTEFSYDIAKIGGGDNGGFLHGRTRMGDSFI